MLVYMIMVTMQTISIYGSLGYDTVQAIQSATINTTDLFGLNNVGEIKVGYEADIIGVLGNPLDDISRLENISFVMKKEIYINNNFIYINENSNLLP